MKVNPATAMTRARRLLSPLVVLCAFGSTAALADDQAVVRAKTTYTVIQLSTVPSVAAINAKGQVAFSEETGPSLFRAKFYDGKTVRDIGTLGGPGATAAALNDLGQVTGDSNINADVSLSHAYRWSEATGMVDISRPGIGNSHGFAINNKGQVAGFAEFHPPTPGTGHAFFWSRQTGMLDIGALGPFGSVANLINDAGTVAGTSEGPEGGPHSILAFRWTRAGGIHGIGTIPDEFTDTTGINAAGHIVGETPFVIDGAPHAFLWTQRDGLIDLGIGSGTRSTALSVNDHDVVVGQTRRPFEGPDYGFVWTRATGLLEFKSQSPELGSIANDVNNSGQVVGAIDNHAFVWTRAEGVVNLNTRIVGAPAGLTLTSATAISDNGSIVATASTGTFLLVPRCPCSK